MQLFKKTDFDFMGKRYIAYAISAVLLLSGIASLIVKKGPKLGIDFTGGTLVQLGFKQPVPLTDLRDLLSKDNYPDAELQDFAEGKSIIVRVPRTQTSAVLLGQELQKLVLAKFPASDPVV